MLLGVILAGHPSLAEEARFIIHNEADLDADGVAEVRSQLTAGLLALEKLPIPLLKDRLPVTVNLYAHNGVSNASGGQGPINLYGLGQRNPAIIHELAHVLTGYRGRGGDAHWVSEGFATYIQDEHGFASYPTRGQPHELAKLLFKRGPDVEMPEIMQARNRTSFFGRRVDAWTRWQAYALSASFTRFLIERHGIAKFAELYAKRSSHDQANAVAKVYGKPSTEVIGGWEKFIAELDTDLSAADRRFDQFERVFRRR